MLLEGVLGLLLAVPSFLPEKALGFTRVLYKTSGIELIHLEPECARYDPELLYTLRPGQCVFSNWEFSTEIRVNSLGVRDDEASLRTPEIIVLGDSHALGWGVDQDEVFAQRIERGSPFTVLNTGISSYATVRQMRLLDRIDTTNLKYLIVQYCDNDYRENKEFYANEGPYA